MSSGRRAATRDKGSQGQKVPGGDGFCALGSLGFWFRES